MQVHPAISDSEFVTRLAAAPKCITDRGFDVLLLNYTVMEFPG